MENEKIKNRKVGKKNIMELAGAFSNNADEWKKIEKIIYEDRKKFKLRDIKL